MPLPDERPRQSVANLIGRFEHKKAPSGTASSPPLRSTSVTSHVTGDSAKEEVREKKEWPPRSSSAVSQNAGDAAKEESREKREWPPRVSNVSTGEWPPKKPSEEISNSSSPPQKSPLSREPSQPIPPVDAQSTQDALETEEKPLSKRQSSLDSKPSAGSNGPAVVVAKLPSSQSTPIASPRTAAKTTKPLTKTPAKIPPSSSKLKPDDRKPSASTAAIVRPSSAAPASGKQSRPSSRAATVRAKTPANAVPPVPKTPSAKLRSSTATTASIKTLQAKTIATSPPKQPSTGLYAPTAASLAKARNAQTPPPERKKVLASSLSLDRLSKPTAASLSKVRKPPVVLSPPPRTRLAPAKSRASAPTRTKPAVTREAVSGGVITAAVLQAQGTLEAEHHENGHFSEEDEHDVVSDSVVIHPDMVLSDLEGPAESSVSYEGEPQHAIDEPAESYDEEEHIPPTDEVSIVDQVIEVEDLSRESMQEDIQIDSPTESLDSTSEPHQTNEEYQRDDSEEHPEQDLEPANQSANDIEDIVNLLETTSFSSKEAIEESVHVEVTKPASVVLIDQAGEIPDEY